MLGLKNTNKSIISQFKKSSIFMENLKRFVVMIAIPLIIINILAAVYYYRSVSLESSMASNQIFSSASSAIEKVYDETEEIYLSLMLEPGMNIFTSTDNYFALNEYEIKSINNIASAAQKYLAPSDTIHSVDVYSFSAKYVISPQAGGPVENHMNKSWYGKTSDDICYTVKNDSSITICYNIFSHKEKIGVIAFTILGSAIKDSAISNGQKHVSIQLADENKNIFYTSAQPLSEKPIFDTKDDKTLVKVHNKYTEMTKKLGNIYLYMTIEHAQPLYSNFVLILMAFIVLVLVLSIILAIILASYSYRSVQEIVLNVNDIEPLSDTSGAINEIMYINQNIISMHNKNQKLEEELLASFANLKLLQTQVLQSQFTPHFLFNALNTLNLSLMLKNGVDNPESKSLVALSELLTEAVDAKNYIISMERELEYCRKYIEVQSYVSNHNFDVEWDIPSETKECIYIKFSLQPIIENAFKHGIKYLKNKKRGLLKISVRRIGNTLETTISNNGPAPSEAEIADINDMLEKGISNSKNHVGLFNVNKRIQLVFGDNYGCNMNVSGELTQVSIITPFVTDFNTPDAV